MTHAARTWIRWGKWATCNSRMIIGALGAPTALSPAIWLIDIEAGGPTAVNGVITGMKWIRTDLGLEDLPLSSPLLRGTTIPRAGRLIRQAQELPLKA